MYMYNVAGSNHSTCGTCSISFSKCWCEEISALLRRPLLATPPLQTQISFIVIIISLIVPNPIRHVLVLDVFPLSLYP